MQAVSAYSGIKLEIERRFAELQAPKVYKSVQRILSVLQRCSRAGAQDVQLAEVLAVFLRVRKDITFAVR